MTHRTGIATKYRSSNTDGIGLSARCTGSTLGRPAPRDVSGKGRRDDLQHLAATVRDSDLVVLSHSGEPGMRGRHDGCTRMDHADCGPDLFFRLYTFGGSHSETADSDRRPAANRLERKHRHDSGPNPMPDGAAEQKSQPRPRRPRHDAFDLLRCKVVWRLVCELFDAAFEPDLSSSSAMARRRPRCHMRQIAMYLSHVVLSVPYATIAAAFGRDRSTVAHSCAVVEDRRDDKAYDRFVERCERCVNAVFQPLGPSHAE